MMSYHREKKQQSCPCFFSHSILWGGFFLQSYSKSFVSSLYSSQCVRVFLKSTYFFLMERFRDSVLSVICRLNSKATFICKWIQSMWIFTVLSTKTFIIFCATCPSKREKVKCSATSLGNRWWLQKVKSYSVKMLTLSYSIDVVRRFIS